MNIENMLNKLDNYSNKNYNHLNNKSNLTSSPNKSHYNNVNKPYNGYSNKNATNININLDLTKIEKVCFTQERLNELIQNNTIQEHKQEYKQEQKQEYKQEQKEKNQQENKQEYKQEQKQKIQQVVPLQIKNKNLVDFFHPKQKDSLFWCFYILKNGFASYELIDNKHFIIEKEEKYKYVNTIRGKKELMKINKVKPFGDIENDLANNPYISIKTFFALCIVEEINIILVHKRKIYKFIYSTDTKPCVVHQSKNTYSFNIEIDPVDEKLKDYLENYHIIENFDNGLRSITYYTVDDLLNICKKLMVDTNVNDSKKTDNSAKKMSKKDLYELVSLHF